MWLLTVTCCWQMQIRSGRYHTLLIKGSKVYSCGSSLCGVLGHGPETTQCVEFTRISFPLPVQVAQVSASHNHAAFVTGSGQVRKLSYIINFSYFYYGNLPCLCTLFLACMISKDYSDSFFLLSIKLNVELDIISSWLICLLKGGLIIPNLFASNNDFCVCFMLCCLWQVYLLC